MIKLLIIFSLVFGDIIPASAQKPLKLLIKENERSIFLVECFNERNELVATGSGFFIDRSGIALTNVHVIKEAFKAKIKTIDNKVYDIEKLIDYNPSLDIAKIKIKNPGGIAFPAITISNYDAEKGDDIFAIGNPDGLENSVSTGIISSIRSVSGYGNCYQITAPISPGSSGGALFNMKGEAIGITTFGQIDQNRLNQNLNFAINIKNSRFLNRNLNLPIETAYKRIAFEGFIPAYMQAKISGDIAKALEICNKQISSNPTDWIGYHFRGLLFVENNEYTRAESDLLKSIQLNNSNELKDMDYVGLGKIYRRSRMFEKAKDAYLHALDINENNAVCYCNMAVLAEEWLGATNPLVEESYLQALKLDPGSCSFGLKKLGEKAMNDHEFLKAINFFTLSIEAESEKSLTLNEYYNRGCSYYYLNEFEKAVEDFRTCLILTPNDYQSYLWIGYCEEALNKKLDACASFNKAKEINDVLQNPTANNQIKAALDKYCN